MNRGIDDNDLRELRGLDRETPGGTMEDRTRLERNARVRADGRRGKPVAAVVHLNVAIPPDLKARLVRECRGRDLKIVDFVRECIEDGLAKLESK